jgi:hypothetical protein
MFNFLSNKNFLVVGNVRNCHKNLIKNYQIFKKAFSFAKKLNFFIIESDSSDNTLADLKYLSTIDQNFNYKSLGSLEKNFPLRTVRLAFCRNHYVKYINKNFKLFDYVVVVDLDQLNNLLSKKNILSCWKKKNWDVCTANQAGPYYDIWSLKHNYLNNVDIWKQTNFVNRITKNIYKAMEFSIFNKMLVIHPSSEWIQVESAFGGLAIYKIKCFVNNYYDGLDKDGSEISDHTSFHERLRKKKYKLYINPSLINFKYNNHSDYFLFLKSLKRFFYYLIKLKFNF